MSARKNKDKIINLLPQEEFASSTFGRILAWLLSSFRTIVIVTEMIVMTAFLSRFWLDAKNTDLSDEIKQKQNVLSSYATFEKDFRATQKKLSVISAIVQKPTSETATFERVGGLVPSEMKLKSIALNSEGISIRGQALTESSINIYLGNLQATNLFSDLKLGQISFDDRSTFLNFTLTGTLGEAKNGS